MNKEKFKWLSDLVKKLIDQLSMAKFRLSKVGMDVDELLSNISFNGYDFHIKRENGKIKLELYKLNKWSLPLYVDDEIIRVLLQPNRHMLHNVFPILFILLTYYGNKLYNYSIVIQNKLGALK